MCGLLSRKYRIAPNRLSQRRNRLTRRRRPFYPTRRPRPPHPHRAPPQAVASAPRFAKALATSSRASNASAAVGCRFPRLALHRPSAALATAATTPWQRRSTPSTRSGSSGGNGHGQAYRRWKMAALNWSTGSTTIACSALSGTSHPPKPGLATMQPTKPSIWV